jgi:hypothetical protein
VAAQLSALGNAQGSRRAHFFRPERAAQWDGNAWFSACNCTALSGRKIEGDAHFPGRCPGLKAALAFQAEENGALFSYAYKGFSSRAFTTRVTKISSALIKMYWSDQF